MRVTGKNRTDVRVTGSERSVSGRGRTLSAPNAGQVSAALLVLLVVSIAAAAGAAYWAGPWGAPVRGSGSAGPVLAAEATDPVAFGQLGDFELIDQTAQPFGLAQLAGKPWVLGAIFTRCAGPCPRLLTSLTEVHAAVAALGVEFVCVTVDPTYDSPDALRAYAAERGADGPEWHFLTGSQAAIDTLLQDGFHLAVSRDEKAPTGLQVSHSTQLSAVDAKGQVRGYYSGTKREGIDALIARLEHLAEEAP